MKNKKIWVTLAVILMAVAAYFWIKKPAAQEAVNQQILSDVPVSVAAVSKGEISNNFTLIGTTFANNDVNIVSQAQGEVMGIYVEVGDPVRNGTLLMQLDDELPRSSLAAAEINFQKARRDFERNETLYQENSISAVQLDAARLAYQSANNQLDIARRQLKNTRITSPIEGTVNARMVNMGTMVSTGMIVANVVDISTLKVIVNVNEAETFQIKPGDSVDVHTDVYAAQTFTGTVETIASKADESHTYRTEIRVANNPKYPLKAGMFARVSFTSITPTKGLVIPRASLVGSIKNARVFVVTNDTAYLRQIAIGKESGDLIQVVEGLQEGDIVVTTGQNNLADNTPVTVVQ